MYISHFTFKKDSSLFNTFLGLKVSKFTQQINIKIQTLGRKNPISDNLMPVMFYHFGEQNTFCFPYVWRLLLGFYDPFICI